MFGPALPLLLAPSASGAPHSPQWDHRPITLGGEPPQGTETRGAVGRRVSAQRCLSRSLANSRREQVRGAVKVLPPEHLRVIDLSYCLGPTHAEIVDFSGLSRGMVKSRLRLGLKKVRDRANAPSMGVPV